MVKKDPIKTILEALRANPEGLTLLSLASVTGLHRHTCRKYVEELMEAGIVFQRDVGVAKLCYLKKKIEDAAEEDRIAERIKRKRQGKYQLRLLAVAVILTFLLSETVIIAYENSTMLNQTNFSNVNTSPSTSTYNSSNLSTFFNISSDINNTENVSVEPPTIQIDNSTVGIVDNTNGTSETGSNSQNTSINETFSNQTIDLNLTENETNSTDFNETIDLNITQNDTNVTSNETSENETAIEPVIPPIEPKFVVKLDYPQKTTRGKVIKIGAVATADSPAKNVYLKWILPQGMEIVSGNEIEACGDLNGISCASEISVKTELSAIGLSEIRVVVTYEK